MQTMFADGTPAKVLDCQPDTVGNTHILALVTPEHVYLTGHGGIGANLYNSLILSVTDLDAIRTEMCKLETQKG